MDGFLIKKKLKIEINAKKLLKSKKMTEIETRKPIWYYCPESDIWCPFENINYIIPLTYPKLSIDEKQAEIDNLKSLFY